MTLVTMKYAAKEMGETLQWVSRKVWQLGLHKHIVRKRRYIDLEALKRGVRVS